MTILKRTAFLTFLSFLLSFHSGAGEIEVELVFPRSRFQLKPAGEYWDLFFPGCAVYPRIGAPKIPSRPVYICLPPGTVPRKVTVIAEEKKELPGRYLLSPVQNPWPGAPPTLPDHLVYDTDQPYPPARVEITGWGDKGGYRIAGLIVNPLEYIPRERKIYLTTLIRLSLSWEEETGLRKVIKSSAPEQNQAVKRLVENPGDTEIFSSPGKDYKAILDPAEYVIITDASFQSQFQTLAAHKEGKGLTTDVITTGWIYGEYAGADEQEKIRNCIIDCYENRGARWVLLGGGDAAVPMRMSRQYGGCPPAWTNIPTDLYYACLDGNWNEDSDGYYGEMEDHPDLYPELVVTRAPVDTAGEAETFVEKIIARETGSADHDQVLLLAEGFSDSEEESEALTGLFPSGWTTKRLYEDYAPFGAEEETRESVLTALSDGYGFVNHKGHGGWNTLCTGAGGNQIYCSDFDALTNGPHSVLYSQGCSTADPDYDNMARRFLLNPAGGGSAYIGNTRIGLTWDATFNRYFIEGSFAETLYRPGEAINYARDALAAQAFIAEPYFWVVSCLNIFGDPETAYAGRMFFALELNDSWGGDGDGFLEPGESALITVILYNYWGNAEGVTMSLSDNSPDLDILVSQSVLGDVAYSAQTDNSDSPFQVSLDPSAPESYEIDLFLDISSTNGYSEVENYRLRRLAVYVDWRNQTGPEDGSREHPYNTIQEAVDAASDNSLIPVAAGTYNENITLKNRIALRGEDPQTTIIDGGNSGSVVTMENLTSCTLKNFTLTHGLQPSPGYGGGILCRYAAGIIIDNCNILENQAHSGGGIYLYRASGTVSNCLIRGNEAVYGGGGVNCWWGCDMNFERDIIAFNEAEKGGGMYIQGTADIVHCDIVGNTATSLGGGINFFGGDGVIRNSIISENNRYGISGELDIYYFAIRYSDLGENTPGNINANPGKYTVTASLSVDPRLVDPENGDFNLQSTSPCRDTGEDIGEPYLGDAPDMGALEFVPPTPLPSPTPPPSAPPTPSPTPSPAPTATPSAPPPTSTPPPASATPSTRPTPSPTATAPPSPSPTPSVSCDFNVSGRVLDRITSSPIVGAAVRMVFSDNTKTGIQPTGEGGVYSFSVYLPKPPGTVRVEARLTNHLPGFALTAWACETTIVDLEVELMPAGLRPGPATGDYDGDGTSDIAIFRVNSGLWAIRKLTRIYFGTDSDDLVPADYEGDGTSDIAIYRATSGLWAIRNLTRVYFGDFSDGAAPSDYNGDGTSDICVFRSTSGLWAVRSVTRAYFGNLNDETVPGDYNGNSTSEIAVFRPASGLWALRTISRFYFGGDDDWPIHGDINGDGTGEPGIFRPASGLWAIRLTTRVYFGSGTDQPVPADFVGDGADEIGIFRESNGLWAVRGITRVYFGSSGDIPVTR